MPDRPGLIERAAALLRGVEQNGERVTSPRDGKNPADGGNLIRPPVATPSAATRRPLIRSATLDRNYLAQNGIMMPWTTTARVVEEFRIIKRNIMFPWQLPEYPRAGNRLPRVVMVTSSRPREGKTFCAINLALAFAAEENLVSVLIDADAVRGDAAGILGLPPVPGLTDVISGEHEIGDVLIQTDLSNLVVLPSGIHGPHVPEKLAGRPLGLMLDRIADLYPEHVIVMDTAPCLASTDPAAIAAVSSQIVFVVEAEHTQPSEIEASLRMLNACQDIRLLLNKTPVGSNEHFGSYSSSYYKPEGTPFKAADV